MTVIRHRPGFASVASLGVITLGVVAFHAVAPNWSKRFGLDVWNYSYYEADQRQTAHERKNLEVSHDRLRRQIEACDRIAGRLVAGELTLAEAAEDASRVNSDRPGFDDCLQIEHPHAGTERLRAARYIMVRARFYMIDRRDTSREVEVMERLEEDYRKLAAAK